MNEIERTFKEEVREKKRAANGVHGKKGKRGYVGAMRTPADLLTGKAKRAYEGTSSVKISKIDPVEIIPYEDFKKLNKQGKTLMLYKLRSKFTARELSSAWGVSDKNVYYLYRAYGVTREKTAFVEDEAVDSKGPQPSRDEEASASKPPKKQADEKRPHTPKNECAFSMVGEYEGHHLIRKLEGLSKMTATGMRYQVEVRVKELM